MFHWKRFKVVLACFVIIISSSFLIGCEQNGNIEISKEDFKIIDIMSKDLLGDTYYIGQRVNIDFLKKQPSIYELRLWSSTESKDWEIVRDFNNNGIEYRFGEEEIIALQVDVKNTKDGTIKQIWLGQFFESEPPLLSAQMKENFLNNDSHNILIQVLIIAYFGLTGFLGLMPLKDKLNLILHNLLAILVGGAIYCINIILLIILGIPINIFTILLISSLFIGGSLFFSRKRYKFVLKEFTLSICIQGMYILIALAITYFNYCFVSYDSVKYIFYGKYLGTYGNISEDIQHLVSSYGLLISTFQVLPSLLKIDLFYSIYPMLNICFAILMGYFVWENTSYYTNKKLYKFLAVAAFEICLYGCYFWVFQSVWIFNNGLTGIYLTITILFTWWAFKTDNESYLYISFFCIAAFSFSRIEAPLQSIIILGIATMLPFKKKILQYYILTNTILILLWYCRLWISGCITNEGDFLTWRRLTPILVGYIFLMIYTFYIESKLGRFIRGRILPITVIGLTLGNLLISFLDIERAIVNIRIMLDNLFYSGLWGYTWIILMIFGLTILILFLIRGDKIGFLGLNIFAIFSSIYLLFLLRTMALRTGFGDSGNRTILHIFPLVIYVIIEGYFKYQNEPTHQNKSLWNRVTGGYVVLSIGIMTGVAMRYAYAAEMKLVEQGYSNSGPQYIKNIVVKEEDGHAIFKVKKGRLFDDNLEFCRYIKRDDSWLLDTSWTSDLAWTSPLTMGGDYQFMIRIRQNGDKENYQTIITNKLEREEEIIEKLALIPSKLTFAINEGIQIQPVFSKGHKVEGISYNILGRYNEENSWSVIGEAVELPLPEISLSKPGIYNICLSIKKDGQEQVTQSVQISISEFERENIENLMQILANHYNYFEYNQEDMYSSLTKELVMFSQLFILQKEGKSPYDNIELLNDIIPISNLKDNLKETGTITLSNEYGMMKEVDLEKKYILFGNEWISWDLENYPTIKNVLKLMGEYSQNVQIASILTHLTHNNYIYNYIQTRDEQYHDFFEYNGQCLNMSTTLFRLLETMKYSCRLISMTRGEYGQHGVVEIFEDNQVYTLDPTYNIIYENSISEMNTKTEPIVLPQILNRFFYWDGEAWNRLEKINVYKTNGEWPNEYIQNYNIIETEE